MAWLCVLNEEFIGEKVFDEKEKAKKREKKKKESELLFTSWLVLVMN